MGLVLKYRQTVYIRNCIMYFLVIEICKLKVLFG